MHACMHVYMYIDLRPDRQEFGPPADGAARVRRPASFPPLLGNNTNSNTNAYTN